MLVVASVVPPKNREVRKAIGCTKVLWLNSRLKLGVGIDYPAPKTIGADRLANAAAVAALYGYPGIVVDFGTAVTFDIVSAQRDRSGTRSDDKFSSPAHRAAAETLFKRTSQRDREIDN